MSEWRARRFWETATPVPCDGGFGVELDGRSVRTPAKAHLVMPTHGFAQAVAAEWMAQGDTIDPLSMPYTRTANAAIDKVNAQRDEVVSALAAYADSDLLCYRADSPAALRQRQGDAWDPALDWAAQTLGARLMPRTGVMHVPQDPAAVSAIRDRIAQSAAFELTALHDLIMLSGSAVLGLAAAANWKPAPEIWATSIVDETWQEEQWGRDEDASAQAEIKKRAFLHAKSAYDLSLQNN